MKLIVGLGNPGDKYFHTRHNLGFAVLDKMAPDVNWSEEKRFKSIICKLSKDLLLIKPQTYMNNSGMAVSLLVNFYKVKPEDIIIIHDDLDLKLGKIKVRIGGSAAGHHGVESIISALGTDQFIRVRLGIGNLQVHSNVEKFVVEPFMPNEKSIVKRMLKKASAALELILDKGLQNAQSQYN